MTVVIRSFQLVQDRVEEIQAAIAALESQRALLGDAVVDTAVAPLHEKLAALDDIAGPAQQRKLITTLFLDVVNSTAMVRDMDPEDHLAIMDGAMRRLTSPIEAHGGRVVKYMGDGLMAIFGHPVARENEPEMAVRAALSMLTLAHDYSNEVEQRWGITGFAVRIGMSTGMAVVGGGTEGENTVAGRHVNLAARLEAAGSPGGLLISHNTYQQVRGLFDIEPQEPISAKGFVEPQAAYLVLRARPRRFLLKPRGVGGVSTRMIGRDSELSLLRQSYATVSEQGEVHLIAVVGEAGIGKTRLLGEFGSWVEGQTHDARIIQGKAYPQMQGTPYGLLRDMLTREFAIQEDDSIQDVWHKFETGFALVLDDREEATMKAHHVGQLTGFNFNASPFLDEALHSPRELRERALAYMGDYISRVARAEPVVVFLEDLHWADGSSLDALEHLISKQESLPILIVAMTRPSLLQRVPGWASEVSSHRRIELSPLSEEDSHLLFAELLQRLEHVPDVLRDIVVDNADGNPFYLEELVRMLIEEGVIIQREPKWRVQRELIGDVHIPTSLTGVIQARLDRLSPQDKIVLQQASVIGRTFWDSSVRYVYGGGNSEPGWSAVAESLVALQDRELIHLQAHSRFAGAAEHSFSHALLRDVTYETVLKRLRRKYHSLAADWLIENSGDRLGESAGLIAGHLVQSARDSEALAFFGQAARLAVASNANQEAIDYLLNALSLIELQPESAEQIELRLDFLTQLGRLFFAAKGFGSSEALQAFEEARTLMEKGGTARQHFAVLHGLSGSAIGNADWTDALFYGDQLLKMAEASGNVTLQLWAHYSLGAASIWSGNLRNASEHQLVQLELYDPAKHSRQFRRVIEDPRLAALGYMAWVYGTTGYPDRAAKYERMALSEAQSVEHPYSLIHTLVFIAGSLYLRRGGAERVYEFAQQAIALADEEDFPNLLAWANILDGWSLAQLSSETRAIDQILDAMKWQRESGSRLGLASFSTLLAEAYISVHEHGKALETIEQGLAMVQANGERFLAGEMFRLRGELLWDSNASEREVELQFREAIAIARSQEVRLLELRAANSLARYWQTIGRTHEAKSLLTSIYGWFNEGFDTFDLMEASELLANMAK